jgi:hypothetical protein
MLKRTQFPRGLFLSLSLCLWAWPAGAQDPGKVIEQYHRAAGGGPRLARVATVSLEGALRRASDGRTGTFTLDVKSPNRYYLELLAGGQPEILAYNGKSAWRISGSGEAATLLEQEALGLEAAAFLAAGHLLDLKKNKIGIARSGPPESGATDVDAVVLTMPTGVKRQLFFDARSHLLQRESGTIGDALLEIRYDDYQPEDGIQVARKMQLRYGQETYEMAVDRVRVNGVIGERVFDFPKKSQVQLPDLKRLFAELDANQKSIDKLKENYTGRRVVEETEYDGSGKVNKLERREETFFYLDGEEISTLVARDGKALSDEEQRNENEKARKKIKQQQERQQRRERKEQEGKNDKEKDDPGIEIFLRTCQFVNPRRERFRGQEVLVFDFEGNPEYKPKNLAERLVQRLAGVVWVDEKAHDVARLEAYLVKDVKFGGGMLANLQKGTSFVFEQAFLDDQVWLPTYQEVHVGARLMLVKGVKVNEITRYSDYHRFNVETLSTIGKPLTDGQPAAGTPKEP